MPKAAVSIAFKATLLRPVAPSGAAWRFLVLPAVASKKLPSRSQVTVDGTLAGHPFQATLDPDGDGGHWFKVDAALCVAAGIAEGDKLDLVITPVDKEPEPTVPADLKKALAGNPAAKATWDDITPVARRDWIAWITSGKKAETRVKRIEVACDKLACGNRRACCFDRSGKFSKGNMGVPEAAKPTPASGTQAKRSVKARAD